MTLISLRSRHRKVHKKLLRFEHSTLCSTSLVFPTAKTTTGRGLRKHFQTHPSHRPEENVRNPALEAAAAANNFLHVPYHHRSARLEELLRLLTQDEFLTVVFCSISKYVSTSSFLLSRSKLTEGSVSESKFQGEFSGGTPYNGLYGEAPPGRGTLFTLQVYER